LKSARDVEILPGTVHDHGTGQDTTGPYRRGKKEGQVVYS